MKNCFNLIGIIFLLSSYINTIPEADSPINPLNIKRTYTKDLGGYSQEEKNAAKKILDETFYPERNKLRERIKLLEAKTKEATGVGYFWNNIKSELKQQYNADISEINMIHVSLKELNKQITNQEIIADERSSALVRTMKYMGTAAIVTAGLVMADQYLNRGIITGNVTSKILDTSTENVTSKILDTSNVQIWQPRGILSYLRDTIIGEPYNIKQASELLVWDSSAKEWKQIEGNEKLAKHAPIKGFGAHRWIYNEAGDIMYPARGEFYFWDEKNGVYRMPTRTENDENLYEKLFVWPKNEVRTSK